MIIQPQQKAQESSTAATKAEVKDEKKSNIGRKVAAAAAVGGVVGGVGTAGAAKVMETPEMEPEVEAQAEESVAQPQPQPAKTAEPVAEPEAEEVPVDLADETDYTGEQNANPVVTTVADDSPAPQAQPAVDEAQPEIQVLGVYQSEDGQEMAVLTDGETVAAVVDTTGDGEANIIAIDGDRNNQIEEGEVHDISDQHISMQPMEEAYLAQQQVEQQEQEAFAYNASDETDFNNDADIFCDA